MQASASADSCLLYDKNFWGNGPNIETYKEKV